MVLEYSYKIKELEMAPSLDGLSEVITLVRFVYTGVDTDTGFSGSFLGSIPMPAPNSSSFTPLSELTEAEVVEWVKVAHPVEHMQEQVKKKINTQITPKNESVVLPWDVSGSIIHPPTV
jgi:hypothetical protein